jgi:hypothetical protein
MPGLVMWLRSRGRCGKPQSVDVQSVTVVNIKPILFKEQCLNRHELPDG